MPTMSMLTVVLLGAWPEMSRRSRVRQRKMEGSIAARQLVLRGHSTESRTPPRRAKAARSPL